MTPTWVFDGSPIADPFGYGERAVRFLRALRHPKSRAPGRAFALDPWQERIVRRVYGPRHEDGSRVVKTVVLLLPRGNRKTSIAAALALLHAIGPERVPGGEVISAAADRKQARLAFTEACGIIRSHDSTSRATRIVDSRNRLTHKRDASFLESISADAGTQHGRTPVFVLADELHAWPKRDLWDVLRSGLPKAPGSLLVVATTAGRGHENVAHDIVDYARKVARGDIDDPATLPILFEASADDDWRDEAVWRAVNPGLSCSPPYPDIEGLRQLAREAENRPGDREAFRQLHLNVWLDHSAAPFVEMAIYDRGATPITDADLDQWARDRAPCWLGVDLSTNQDLTAVVAAFRDGPDGYAVVPFFFCPRDSLRARAEQDRVPYVDWAREGFIEATPGNAVDYRRVEARIRELCDRFNVREIAFDPWRAGRMMTDLAEDGLPAVEMRQGAVSMVPAVKELERAVIAGRFRHGAHPVLRWNFANIAVKADHTGSILFDKEKSRERIDGAQAAAMAVGRAFAAVETSSPYRRRGLYVI
ncbi:terminase TerL endonuclease subunit [Methylopila sp. 73B]|uniref:terminase large subunit n=1 Tax=Methylopila sp. 73B TaxID=1120792 RepID=UPI0003806065|nr:terminase TerL endonuclease subunit [Methylopila sp. 73B]